MSAALTGRECGCLDVVIRCAHYRDAVVYITYSPPLFGEFYFASGEGFFDSLPEAEAAFAAACARLLGREEAS